MSTLDRIRIKGFKSIEELDLELDDLNVIIGPNAVGKSNFISLFSMFNSLERQELQHFVTKNGGADSLLHYGSKETSEIKVSMYFGENAYDITLEPTSNDQLMISREICRFYTGSKNTAPDGWYRESINNGGALESNLRGSKVKSYGPPLNVLRALKSWKVYHFHDTSETAGLKKTGNINDNRKLKTDASNLAAFLYKLKQKHTDHYRKIVRTVKQIVPFFGDFNLHPNELKKDTIRLEWYEEGSEQYFNAYSLSDGTIRFICLATLLLQPDLPSTIIIDEPELGLHPFAITVLASLLRKASRRSQIIISTQSVNLVNEFYAEEIIVADRSEQQTTLKRLETEELDSWLEQFSIGEIWEKNLIGGRP